MKKKWIKQWYFINNNLDKSNLQWENLISFK